MDERDLARAAGTAAQLVGRTAMLKVVAVATAAFVVFLLVLGILGATGVGAAYASSCGTTGLPGAGLPGGGGAGAPAPGSLHAQQIANAKVIDQQAQAGGLPGRATLIALMTAEQESTLLNLNHGDADSLGLFQQRPSQGWGTAAEIMTPSYSAHAFFFGAGGNRGLTQVPGWQSMDLGAAAQAVQHSAYPQLYDGQQDAATQIAQEAGIDLTRAGSASGPGPVPSGTDAGPPGSCYPQQPGQPGQPFHDSNAPWPAIVKNPRSTADAVAWVELQATSGTSGWYRACLSIVARAYGWNSSGTTYAIDHYYEMPASMRHDGDRNPPLGALLYWDTGHRAGHVAIYVGNGEVASNDIERPNYISIVPATEIETKWGAHYVGWAPPYFPNGG